MALICASRYGLSDSELLDLLANIPEFCSNVTHCKFFEAYKVNLNLFILKDISVDYMRRRNPSHGYRLLIT